MQPLNTKSIRNMSERPANDQTPGGPSVTTRDGASTRAAVVITPAAELDRDHPDTAEALIDDVAATRQTSTTDPAYRAVSGTVYAYSRISGPDE